MREEITNCLIRNTIFLDRLPFLFRKQKPYMSVIKEQQRTNDSERVIQKKRMKLADVEAQKMMALTDVETHGRIIFHWYENILLNR